MRTPTPAPVRDARGRIVPTPLVPVFVSSRKARERYRKLAGHLGRKIGSDSGEPWGAALAPVLKFLAADLDKVANDAAAALPYCCCPHVDQETGRHATGGRCRVCVGNRGWITRHNWFQLADPVKRLIDSKKS